MINVPFTFNNSLINSAICFEDNIVLNIDIDGTADAPVVGFVCNEFLDIETLVEHNSVIDRSVVQLFQFLQLQVAFAAVGSALVVERNVQIPISNSSSNQIYISVPRAKYEI
ncbi:hypothetical protein T4B_858 [Trichinella pseudospiralis]|uniref:Uncharacterized protein n=1 Tax=Trichinella pseudospiralis TaxID=6337 RepID=A0A0V1IL09_TRIPS|nr:hypothetical protein T4B_858 [Trichinella pseudospiralis]